MACSRLCSTSSTDLPMVTFESATFIPRTFCLSFIFRCTHFFRLTTFIAMLIRILLFITLTQGFMLSNNFFTALSTSYKLPGIVLDGFEGLAIQPSVMCHLLHHMTSRFPTPISLRCIVP
eukprot:Gb_25956 [translate_table: standard]